MTVELKQFGLRSTGTRYIRNLIDRNFDGVKVAVHKPMWKHAPFVPIDGFDGYLITVKHPEAWVTSAIRYYNRNEFKIPPHPRLLAEDWARINWTYLEASKMRDDVAVVRYEELLEDHERVLKRLERQFGFQKVDTWDHYANLSRDIFPVGDDYIEGEKADEYNKAYYLDGWYYKELNSDMFGEIRDQISMVRCHHVVTELGYSYPEMEHVQDIQNSTAPWE